MGQGGEVDQALFRRWDSYRPPGPGLGKVLTTLRAPLRPRSPLNLGISSYRASLRSLLDLIQLSLSSGSTDCKMSSTTITLTTPATALPNDPTSLSKLIRQRHLVALQALYEQRTLQHIAQQERLARQRRQKRLAALGAEEGTPTSSEVEMTEEVEEDPKVVEASDRRTLYKALYLSEPTSSTASAAPPNPSSCPSSASHLPPPIDRLGHAYDFVYHLAPNGLQEPPFFDPTGLTSNQLLPKATELFQAPFRNTASSSSTTTTTPSTNTLATPSVVPSTETIDVVEAELIASFSASCDERIGETLAKMEQPDREVALQRRDYARYAIGVANAAQLQQLQQHRSGVQMQVGSSGGVHGSVVGPQGAGGYGAWR
ncbi:BQ5605_C010g06041 [Microbotryum silenes-dioicae]|uniref:BQ5605_C010g06041 protein n=1 Tax=Microbotryum silenes-dioicae TaxID=796604 RepID=A0A2X0NMF3_9BASI|nr:BQ5605_C010g06041 [Microbotryum silenes-dioicae]